MRRSLPAQQLVITIAALLAAVPLAAQPPATPTTTTASPAASPDFIAGMKALDAQKYAAAITSLQKVVAAEPSNEPAWFSLGVAKFSNTPADLPGALEAFRQALSLVPDRPGTRLYIGRIYEAQGAYDEASAVFAEEGRRTTGANQAQAQVALARTYLKEEAYTKARDTALLALATEPKYVEALYIEGRALAGLKDYAGAIAVFKQAKDILTDWTDLNATLQSIAAHPEEQPQQKVTEEGMAQDYNWAQDFAQKMGMWPALNKALGDAYLGSQDYMMARVSYRAAGNLNELGDKSDPDVPVRLARAYLADAINQFTADDALFAAIAILDAGDQSVDAALALNDRYAPAYEIRGEIYAFQAATYDSMPKSLIQTHTWADAETAFTKALAGAPDDAAAMAGLANVYVEEALMKPGSQAATKSLQKAQGLMQQALTLQPDVASNYVLLGHIALAQGDYDQTRAYAEKAEALDSKSAEAYNLSGLANYYTANLSQALRDIGKAIELSPHDSQYHFNLGNVYFQMQSWYMARREYNLALKYTPTALLAKTSYQRAYILYQVALTYHETRGYDSEIDVLNQALVSDIGYFEAYMQLARAYAAKGEYRGAQRALSQAQQRAANNQESSQVYTLSGQIYEMAGDVHSAVEAYSSAVPLDKTNLIAQEALSRLSGQ
jgi:tetratricopeptide (TPR) repeat protein